MKHDFRWNGYFEECIHCGRALRYDHGNAQGNCDPADIDALFWVRFWKGKGKGTQKEVASGDVRKGHAAYITKDGLWHYHAWDTPKGGHTLHLIRAVSMSRVEAAVINVRAAYSTQIDKELAQAIATEENTNATRNTEQAEEA